MSGPLFCLITIFLNNLINIRIPVFVFVLIFTCVCSFYVLVFSHDPVPLITPFPFPKRQDEC